MTTAPEAAFMSSGSSPVRMFAVVLTLVAALCALVLGGAAPALAHAGLSGSDPADGAVLVAAPEQVTLTFTESVSFPDGALRVLSPANDRVNPSQAQHADGRANTARVALRGGLAQGTYTVAWRVVSADGHAISGAFTFSIGKPSVTTAVVAKTSPDDTAASRLYGFFRYVAYSGLALLVGAVAFVLVCWPAASGIRPLRRLVVAGWATLVASTVALLLLRGPYEAGGPLSSAFDVSVLGHTLTGRSGIALTVRLVLLALLALAAGLSRQTPVRLGVRLRLVAGPVVALGLALTWAAAEHASAGVQVPLAIPVAVLHLLAMAVWLGGLIALLISLRHRGPDGGEVPASAITRFSAMAFAAVAVLVGTGVYQSWRQVGSWAALSTTSYGRTLGLKVTAVVLVLCVAALSRRWTARLVGEASPGTAEPAAVELAQVRVPQTVGAPSPPEGAGPGGNEAASARGEPGDAVEPPVFDAERYRRRLRRTVGVEAAVGAVVLVLSTMLTGTQPSRAAAGTGAAPSGREPDVKVVMVPFDMGTANHRGTVQITLAPGRVGENTVEAVVFTPDGGISTVPELRLALTQRDQGIGPIDAKLENQKGYWATYDLRLPMAGTWDLNVTIRTTDIDQVTVSTALRVTP
ncbi:copper resistance protein CopC [Streptomyces sp. NBC_01565]|uniref:copper resistance CopC/CopD family protein n=1 Tax=unclassified Streptomyces TaxID=2593676 RepID=UPI002253D069|nr:copper resistance protein CopC [Streptomyces sp. NBC_01565]MCX4539298.1 copper resistance protein CopC/CopD [Streptomyces sp. NBC_01565]